MKILIIQGGIDSDLVTGEQVVIANDIAYLEENGNEINYEFLKISKSGLNSVFGHIGGLIWSFANYSRIQFFIKKYNL